MPERTRLCKYFDFLYVFFNVALEWIQAYIERFLQISLTFSIPVVEGNIKEKKFQPCSESFTTL